jgi:hypothetical protein
LPSRFTFPNTKHVNINLFFTCQPRAVIQVDEDRKIYRAAVERNEEAMLQKLRELDQQATRELARMQVTKTSVGGGLILAPL